MFPLYLQAGHTGLYSKSILWEQSSINDIQSLIVVHIPGSLTGICAMDVTQLAETEAIASRRVNVAIYRHHRAAGGHLEHLTHLDVHFKVGD